MTTEKSSQSSIERATKTVAEFSGQGDAKGAKGYRDELAIHDMKETENLSKPGQEKTVSVPAGGFGTVTVGLSWDNIVVEQSGFFSRLFKKATKQGVDLDLGCLFEMQDGRRGAVQGFGNMFGDFDNPPYLKLSGDNRTGNAPGADETMSINGAKWAEIKRILIYTYIYDGVANWSQVKPVLNVAIPGETPMEVRIQTYRDEMEMCAVALIENVKGGIRMKNQSEYYHGHAEMDRAYGFGIRWEQGAKE